MKLPCKVVDGLMPTEKIALIESAEGQTEEIMVSQENLIGDSLIADEIGRQEGKILVELPRETASGRWRIWVKDSTLLQSTVGA
jgi:hypothetical protein